MERQYLWAMAGLAMFVLSACESDLSQKETPSQLRGPYFTEGGNPPQGPDGEGGFDYGQWRTADPRALAASFLAQVRTRYPAGQSLRSARVDLEARGFGCIEGSRRVEGRPVPDLECRRDVLERRCTWHWVVELDGGGDVISDARGRYDVFCVGGSAP